MDKYLYIFKSDFVSDSYHQGGSVLIIASSVTEARNLIKKYQIDNDLLSNLNKEEQDLYDKTDDYMSKNPIYSVKVPADTEEKILVFPNAGCC